MDSPPGRSRGVVEQAFVLLRWFRRLRIRGEVYETFMTTSTRAFSHRRLCYHLLALTASQETGLPILG
jgi:hypothetical protein